MSVCLRRNKSGDFFKAFSMAPEKAEANGFMSTFQMAILHDIAKISIPAFIENGKKYLQEVNT
jgi:hypothetical protein